MTIEWSDLMDPRAKERRENPDPRATAAYELYEKTYALLDTLETDALARLELWLGTGWLNVEHDSEQELTFHKGLCAMSKRSKSTLQTAIRYRISQRRTRAGAEALKEKYGR